VAPGGTVRLAVATPLAPVTPEALEDPSVKSTVLPASPAKGELAGPVLNSSVALAVIIERQDPEPGLMEDVVIRVGVPSVKVVCASDTLPVAVR
jgi:hypothetical protein